MNPTPDEQQNLNAIFAKLAKLPTANLEVDAVHGFLVVCYIQLACKHPEAPKDTNKRMELFARTIQDALASRLPEVGELLEKGWHREYDVQPVVVEDEGSMVLSSLHPFRQQEIVANGVALHQACQKLAKLTKKPMAQWLKEFAQEANDFVDTLPESKISEQIQAMDEMFLQLNSLDDDNDNN